MRALVRVVVAGLVVGGARRFAVVFPAALVYYLTVASADNWAGAVCNLGRYFMPVAPLLIAFVAVVMLVIVFVTVCSMSRNIDSRSASATNSRHSRGSNRPISAPA